MCVELKLGLAVSISECIDWYVLGMLVVNFSELGRVFTIMDEIKGVGRLSVFLLSCGN